MQTNAKPEPAPTTSADKVKCNKKIQFHHHGIDHYPLMSHNGLSNNALLLYVLSFYWMNQIFKSMFLTELIGRYLDLFLSVGVLWEEDGALHNSNCGRTVRQPLY